MSSVQYYNSEESEGPLTVQPDDEEILTGGNVTLYTSVPLAGFAPDYLTGSTVPYQADLHAADRQRRIELFFEAYGLPVPEDLHDWLTRRLTAMCDTLKKEAEAGNPAFVTMVEEGHLAHYERELQFIADHYSEWTTT